MTTANKTDTAQAASEAQVESQDPLAQREGESANQWYERIAKMAQDKVAEAEAAAEKELKEANEKLGVDVVDPGVQKIVDEIEKLTGRVVRSLTFSYKNPATGEKSVKSNFVIRKARSESSDKAA